MKKQILIIMSLIILMLSVSVFAQSSKVEIYKDKAVFSEGGEKNLSSPPFMYKTDKEYLYVPIEDIMPSLGANLGWDSARNAEICIIDGKTFYIYPDKNEIELDGQMLWCDAPSIVKNNVFYISSEHIKMITDVVVEPKSDIDRYGIFTVIAKQDKAYVNGMECKIEAQPYIYESIPFIPLDSAFLALGYSLGYDSEQQAVICYKDGVYSYIYTQEGKVIADGAECRYDYTPVYIKNIMYISADIFKTITGFEVKVHGIPRGYKMRDTLSQTARTDAYRLSGGVTRGGGVTVVGNFGMELVSMSQQNALNYAGVLNAVADTLGDVNVYNILVPTAAEFYAPLSMYPDQLTGIKTVYENLSDKVTPINVYDTLKEHADEKIYFKTDHHWTQRGAYYAYKEFIEQKGGVIDDLSSFTNVPSYNFVGSFAGFAKGTAAGNIMRANPELLERFMPKFATVGTVFSDGLAVRAQYTVKAVNTANNSYSCFIGGDAPVTVFYTDAPSDESIVIIKESFGNAFATWAMHNYKKVCIVDPRRFNGFGGNYTPFNLKTFCDRMDIDDVVFINYPVVVSSSGIRQAILNMK